MAPDDYAITAYDAALVIIDAVKTRRRERQTRHSRRGARRDPDLQGDDHPGRRVVR